TGGALEPAALLARCRPALLDALEHPLMTQGLAARLVGRESLGDRPPFGGVYFNLNPRLPALDFPGLAARFAEGEKPGLLGEVMFNFYELPEGLRLDLHYSTDFFSAGRIEALVAALARRLGDASAPHAASAGTPATVVANAPVAAKAPAADAAAGATARALLDGPRREAGARTALRFAGQGRDYATLDARIRAIGAALHAAGVRPGGRVGVSVRRGFDLPAALLGVWEAGAAYVPLDPALPPGRLAHMVEDAGITVILADGADTVPERLRAGRQVLALDRIGEAPSGWQRPALTPAHPAYVLYTSGSTGKPKGVEVGQGNVAAFLEAMRQRPGITSDDRLLAVTTPAFDISVLELFLPLSVGACVVLASEDEARNPDRFWPLFERERPSLLQATPSVLAMWLGDAPAERFRDTTLLLGGEGLPLALARRLAPACKALWNMYGPTETTVWSSCWRVPHAPERISVGEAIAGTTLRVLDAALMPVPPGEEGEIVIAGAGVAQGYLNLPALTEERFVRLPDGERAYRTGDRGRWLPEGTLEHLGRMDAQVKLRGYRIELGEIEAVLEQAPGVLQAVVSVREDRPGDQRLVAHLRVDGARFDADEALARCRDELPEYMLPQHLVPMAAFPLLPSGKVDRKALPAPEQPATAPGRAPADAAEATVCRIMAEL
ncbi:amino acid adenylation domain-containing protein, partial [Silanimonas lenta]|uniref:amino acid adenylation domain-containing protein n=1 Tax=Silanimonas lenta TaxID=265429 RepID=UPI002FE1A1B8